MRAWRIAVLLFLTLLALYVATTRGHFVSTDEVTVYQAAQSLWENGNVSVRVHDTREVFRGRGGAFYGQYNSGQSIAVVPLYAIGRFVDRVLDDRSPARAVFAGHHLERPGVVWAGEVPIFFVNLCNAFLTAALMAVFFLLAMQMTGNARWSLLAALLLGSTSYIASFSDGFFQHTSEALFSLCAFALFFLDRQAPRWRYRLGAGIALAVMILFRYPAVVALPGLLTYHAASIWMRQREEKPLQRLRWAALELLPASGAVAAGLVLRSLDQYWKFGTFGTVGYEAFRFDTPLAIGAYGYLFSPGMSIFVYTPLLVLVPFALPSFHARFRAEAWFLLLHFCAYLFVYGRFMFWHGLWYFGPRYLAPLIPFLFLPIAVWMAEKRWRALVPVIPFALLGLWMQVIHVAVNFWNVALFERYADSGPQREFLFIPYNAPFLAQSRALFAGDRRVDMWLVDVARFVNGPLAVALALGFTAAVILGLTAIARELERQEGESLPRPARYAATAVPAALAAFALLLGSSVHVRAVARTDAARHEADRVMAASIVIPPRAEPAAPPPAPAPTTRPPGVPRAKSAPIVTDEELMQAGIDALYRRRDTRTAEVCFRTVIARTPAHYGAHYQLAVALDRSGRAQEARSVWTNVLKFAELYRDQPTIATARERLNRQ